MEDNFYIGDIVKYKKGTAHYQITDIDDECFELTNTSTDCKYYEYNFDKLERVYVRKIIK